MKHYTFGALWTQRETTSWTWCSSYCGKSSDRSFSKSICVEMFPVFLRKSRIN